MSRPYQLCYWPIPFRGQLIRTVLAYLDADWQEAEMETIRALKSLPVESQPVPFMAPPMLSDPDEGVHLAQLNAILVYLGEKHGLMPQGAAKRALTIKILCDANDILDEITRYGGRQMWDEKAWTDFISHRFPRWLAIFERTAIDHGATPEAGTMLGTEELSLADLVTSALFTTMMERLEGFKGLIEGHAPVLAALVERVGQDPAIAAFNERQKQTLGDLYCAGQIEQSLRQMIREVGLGPAL